MSHLLADVSQEGQEQAISFKEGFFASQQKFERLNQDALLKRRGIGVYSRMLADDQVSAAFNLIASSITAREWRFEGDNEEVKAYFIDMIENKYKGEWTTVIENLLYGLIFGFMLLEKIFTIEEFQGKDYWMITELKTRPLNSFSFESDKFANIINLLQDQGKEKKVKLDLEKFLYYVYQPVFDPHYGRSILFPAYRHYWAKDNILKFWNIFLERAAVGFIHGKIDGELTPTTKSNLEKSLSNLSASSYILTPNNVELEYVDNRDMSAFERAIDSKDRAISRSMLVPSTIGITPQDSTGTVSQTEVHFEEVFFHWVKRIAGQVSDVLNDQLFRPLSILNFGEENPPTFEFDELLDDQKRKISKSWSELIKAGAVTATIKDENHTRKLMNYPEITPVEREAEQEDEEEMPMNPISTGEELNIVTNAFADRTNLGNIQNVFEDLVSEFEVELQEEVNIIAEEVKEMIVSVDSARDIKLSRQAKTSLKRVIRSNLKEIAKESRAIARKEINKLKNRKTNAALTPQLLDSFISSKVFKMLSEIVDSAVLERARQIFMNGIKSELSEEELVRELTEILQPYLKTTDAKGRELNASVAVRRTVRTVTTEIFNESRKVIFEAPELDGFVVAYEYSAILDAVTTEFCRTMDEKIWPVDDPRWKTHTPPNHFNCRSLLIPVTKLDTFKESSGLPSGIEPDPGFGAT